MVITSSLKDVVYLSVYTYARKQAFGCCNSGHLWIAFDISFHHRPVRSYSNVPTINEEENNRCLAIWELKSSLHIWDILLCDSLFHWYTSCCSIAKSSLPLVLEWVSFSISHWTAQLHRGDLIYVIELSIDRPSLVWCALHTETDSGLIRPIQMDSYHCCLLNSLGQVALVQWSTIQTL